MKLEKKQNIHHYTFKIHTFIGQFLLLLLVVFILYLYGFYLFTFCFSFFYVIFIRSLCLFIIVCAPNYISETFLYSTLIIWFPVVGVPLLVLFLSQNVTYSMLCTRTIASWHLTLHQHSASVLLNTKYTHINKIKNKTDKLEKETERKSAMCCCIMLWNQFT